MFRSQNGEQFLLRILRKKWIFFKFPEQVENMFTISRLKVIKGGGDLQNKCVFMFSATQ